MKKYHVVTGDGKYYYGVGYESYRQAESVLRISQMHDPQAHIVEEEYPVTKAELIRSMSDDDLAAYLADHYDALCQNKPECVALLDTDEGIPEEKCVACALEWLRSPAKEEKS